MKGITNKGIEEDKNVIIDMLCKYNDAVWEPQEGQPAHYDNQPKFVRLAIRDVQCGLTVALSALRQLSSLGDIEED